MNANEMPLVRMENIGRTFGNIVALQDVNFEVGYQEVIGLLGDNGAGKSTLIKVLTGIHSPTSGQIYFEGRPVDIGSPQAARELGIDRAECLCPVEHHVLDEVREPALAFRILRAADIEAIHRRKGRSGVTLYDKDAHAVIETGLRDRRSRNAQRWIRRCRDVMTGERQEEKRQQPSRGTPAGELLAAEKNGTNRVRSERGMRGHGLR